MKNCGRKPGADSLPARLTGGLGRLCAVLRSQAWSQQKHSGLSPTQTEILTILARAGRVGASLSAVAGELQVTNATASVAVATLVRKRLVHKGRSAVDGRAVRLLLTAPGAARVAATGTSARGLTAVVAGLPVTEQRALLNGLVHLLCGLEAAGALPVARVCVACENFRANVHPGKSRPHRCTFLNRALASADFHLDCPAHRHLSHDQREHNWAQAREPAQ